MDTIERLAPARTGEVKQIAPQVWRVVATNSGPLTGPGTNSYVVGESRGIVIDPGPDDEAHLERLLEVAGGRVDMIVCTHSHTDHSPGAAPLAARTGARVVGMPAPRVDEYQDGTYRPDRVPVDGDRLSDGGFELTVLHTPGHASNHICLLEASSGLLFTGDHLMHGSTVAILPPDGSMSHYLDSLARLRTLPVRDLAPGHGALIEDAHAEIERVIAHRMKRESKVVAALESRGTATLDDILPEVYADVPVAMHPMARYSMLAHVLKLEDDRRVMRAGDSWVWVGEASLTP